MEYIVLLFFLGVCFGSFVNALVWRLHEERDFVKERSECVHCHHELAWFDLVPIFSWLWLRGKCRYCQKPISLQYPIVELITGLLFVGSYLYWPFSLASLEGMILLVLWLIMLVLLVALAIYDWRWYLLPQKLTFPLIGMALAFGVIKTMGVLDLSILMSFVYLLLGVTSVAGLYFVLHALSHGRWVGFGDVVLGIAMGLILGWQLGLLAVFVANIVGLMVMLPAMVIGKVSGKTRIPFGPFLIVGLMISLFFGSQLIDAYISFILSI